MKGRTLSIMLAIWMISVAFVGLTMNVRAADNYQNNQTTIALTSNNYPGGVPNDWYYPGDSITGKLFGNGASDGLEDILDVVAADDDGAGGCDAFVLANVRLQADNIALDPTSGEGTFSFPGSSTQYLSDGFYCAWVAPGDYLEGVSPVPYRGVRFQIHEYRISASTDRTGYIAGNKVTVFYIVSRLKDGAPMTMSGYASNWLVQSTPGGETYAYGSLSQSAGQFNFTLSNTGGATPLESYPIYLWFNNTGGGANRRDSETLFAQVGDLTANIVIPGAGWTYAPGGLIDIEVNVDVVVPGPNPDYPGAGVTIKILDGPLPTSPPMTAFEKTFTTDGKGAVEHEFILDPAVFLDGKTYTISVNASSVLEYDTDTEVFFVRKSTETMSVRLTLDKQSYYSDETAVLTVAAQPPSGHSQPSTYVYEISSGGSLFARVSSSSSSYAFHIPRDFAGLISTGTELNFRADVYNVEGDYGWDEEERDVFFGFMIVNVRPFEYNAGDQLTVSFELKSTVMTPLTTSFFYQASDGFRTVEQGPLTPAAGELRGSFTFTVPSVPATSYTFYVSASGGGHVIVNSASASLIEEFILTIEFDKETYRPGETMTVTYSLAPRVSTTPLPRTFQFSYGLVGYRSVSYSTTEPSGAVTYVVPNGANQGDTLFGMTEGPTGAGAIEVVFIGEPPSKPAEIAGIEIFDAFLLVLIVILFLLMLVMRARGTSAAPPKPREEKAAPPPPPGPTASPMIVNCKACGAPIEITTSKRPIEVMCPSCGETAMVQ